MPPQVDARIPAGEQRREIRLGAQIQIDRTRRRLAREQGAGYAPRAAGRLDDDRTRLGIRAAPQPHQRVSQLSELRFAQQRLRLVQKILCIGQGSKRQRLPERQDDARFIEQAADQRRTYVPGVEDEVHRTRIAHATSRLGYARQRRPPALRSGRQNSIIQEAGRAGRRPDRTARAETLRARDRISGRRRPATQPGGLAGHRS